MDFSKFNNEFMNMQTMIMKYNNQVNDIKVRIKNNSKEINRYEAKIKSTKNIVEKDLYKTLEDMGDIVVSEPSAQDIEDERFDYDFSVILVTDGTVEKAIAQYVSA